MIRSKIASKVSPGTGFECLDSEPGDALGEIAESLNTRPELDRQKKNFISFNKSLRM